MRRHLRLWRSRKAVSTMIGGIIILTLVLTALTTMVLVTQQYDAYQTILNQMSQRDIERFSENLAAQYPGIVGPTLVNCGSSQCNQYSAAVSNFGGIGTQVVRIYINNTSSCYGLCIFDPSNVSAPFRFQSAQSFVNPNEINHGILFWLPSSAYMQTDSYKANTISLATGRGRVFSFPFPFPPAGISVTSDLHLDVGPFRIVYNPNLITYTIGSPPSAPGPDGCANADPSSNPCIPGSWKFPTALAIVFYVRINNIGNASVRLLGKSHLLAQAVDSPDLSHLDSSSTSTFYIINPMSNYCHDRYFGASYYDPYTWPNNATNCPTPTYPAAQDWTYKILNGTTPQCSVNNPCYNLPSSTLGQPSQETYILFSATNQIGQGSTIANHLSSAFTGTYIFTLVLAYYYNGYEYQITIPLLSCYNKQAWCTVSG